MHWLKPKERVVDDEVKAAVRRNEAAWKEELATEEMD